MSILPQKRMTAVESLQEPRRSRSKATGANVEAPGTSPTQRPPRRVVYLALAGAALLWAAFPPVGWSMLAWAAPIPWLLLVRGEKLEGRRPYLVLWLGGWVHWLAVLQGVRLAHWATYFGWIALTAYLAFYLPVFIAVTRAAVHRMKVPLFLAAPVVWTGLEYARAYFATGFSLAQLGHTQVRWTPLIQISDLAGAYAVSFLVMFVAACLASCLPRGPLASLRDRRQRRWAPLVPAAAIVAAALAYGRYRTSQPGADDARPPLKAALVQAWTDTIFEYDPERDEANYNIYADLSREAVREHPDLQVILWPESAFTGVLPLITRDSAVPPKPAAAIDEMAGRFNRKSQKLARDLGGKTELVVGVSAAHYGARMESYNAAIQITPDGEIAARYDKIHAVMFGEYVPLGDWLPWLYRLTPLGGGLSRGQAPQAFEVAGLRLAPSICFESTVPQLIRRHVVDLARLGRKPDVLVNHTNDGWFWGSSIADLHLACGVFRAVEHRTPMLIAANTGLSASIDGDGRIRVQGPRFKQAILVAEVRPDLRQSLYTRYGDWAAALCLAFCGMTAACSVITARIAQRKQRDGR